MNPLIRKVNKQYAKKRERNQREMKQRKIAVYRQFPAIKTIDDELVAISRQIIALIQRTPEEIARVIGEAEHNSKQLKGEKQQILSNAGLPADYLEPIYDCPQCKDKGYLETGGRCPCFESALVQAAYQFSDLHQKLEKENFAHFKMDLFSDQIIDQYAMSPRQNMEQIYDLAVYFIDNFDSIDNKNLLFQGGSGRGKTFMLTCIAKALMDRGKTVVYQTAHELFRVVNSNEFDREISEEDKLRYQMIFNAELLLIDDLGTEMPNSFTKTELFNIINIRLLKEKKTVISTNLTEKELSDIYGDRIFSRLIGHYIIKEFFGQDIRPLLYGS